MSPDENSVTFSQNESFHVAAWAFQVFKGHLIPDGLDVGIIKRLSVCVRCACVFMSVCVCTHTGVPFGHHQPCFFAVGSLPLGQGLITLAGLADPCMSLRFPLVSDFPAMGFASMCSHTLFKS